MKCNTSVNFPQSCKAKAIIELEVNCCVHVKKKRSIWYSVFVAVVVCKSFFSILIHTERIEYSIVGVLNWMQQQQQQQPALQPLSSGIFCAFVSLFVCMWARLVLSKHC